MLRDVVLCDVAQCWQFDACSRYLPVKLLKNVDSFGDVAEKPYLCSQIIYRSKRRILNDESIEIWRDIRRFRRKYS